MRTVRVLVASGLAMAAIASTAHAGAQVALDGRRRTHASYSGTLQGIAMNLDSERLRAGSDPLTPTLDDCTKDSCDITPVKLSVPRGSSAGRLTVSVNISRSMNAYVILYDSKSRVVMSADQVEKSKSSEWQNRQMQGCCSTQYILDFTEERIRPGSYQLVVYNRGGTGSFTANLDFKAHPADRRLSR